MKSEISPYNKLSKYYDLALGDREEEFANLVKLLGINLESPRDNSKRCTGLELGCGTGSIMELFSNEIDIKGLDNSQGMIDIAKKKLANREFIHSGMEEFNLNEKFDFIYSVQDSVNHLLDKNDWMKMIECVISHLKKNGVFVFDINTIYLLEKYSDMYPMLYEIDGNLIQINVSREKHNIYNWNLQIEEKSKTKPNVSNVIEGDIKELGLEVNSILSILNKYFKNVELFDFYHPQQAPSDISERIWFRCMN